MQRIQNSGRKKSTRHPYRPREKMPRFRFPSNCIHILALCIVLLLIVSPVVSEQGDVVEEPIDSVEITANVAAILTGNITVSQVSTSGAQISWMTNVPSDSWVYYDTISHQNAEDYARRVKNDFYTLSHLLVLSGLSPGTVYHFRIVSHGSGGISVTSADMVFRTISIPPTGGGGGGGGSYGSFFSVVPFTSPVTTIPIPVETPLPTSPPYGSGSGNATYGNWSAGINVTPAITSGGELPEQGLLSFIFQRMCLFILLILIILALILIYFYYKRRRED